MDFYIVLGVERGAPAGEIKRAYKRLARRLHPDINPGDREAEARFRQVLDAYETLMDPDRRRRYDAGQLVGGPPQDDDRRRSGLPGLIFQTASRGAHDHVWRPVRGGALEARTRPAEGAEHGADIHARTTLTFEEAWHGVQRDRDRDAAGCVPRLRGQRLPARRRNALRVVRRHGRGAIGARAHGVCEDVSDLRRRRPAETGRVRARATARAWSRGRKR